MNYIFTLICIIDYCILLIGITKGFSVLLTVRTKETLMGQNFLTFSE